MAERRTLAHNSGAALSAVHSNGQWEEVLETIVAWQDACADDALIKALSDVQA